MPMRVASRAAVFPPARSIGASGPASSKGPSKESLNFGDGKLTLPVLYPHGSRQREHSAIFDATSHGFTRNPDLCAAAEPHKHTRRVQLVPSWVSRVARQSTDGRWHREADP